MLLLMLLLWVWLHDVVRGLGVPVQHLASVGKLLQLLLHVLECGGVQEQEQELVQELAQELVLVLRPSREFGGGLASLVVQHRPWRVQLAR